MFATEVVVDLIIDLLEEGPFVLKTGQIDRWPTGFLHRPPIGG